MAAGYASDTSVPVERSRAEIEQVLVRYGADQFISGWDADMALIQFRAKGRHLKFMLPLPKREEFRVHLVRGYKRPRTPRQIENAWQQEMRRRWRCLLLVLKAKLEAVATGITTFDEEFLAHIVLPDGRTVGNFMLPQVEEVYATGKMPALLPRPE